MFERADDVTAHWIEPTVADLHWRGFGEFAESPWFVPLTPVYEKVSANPKWRITPSGWCTRYGDVRELIAKRGDALALLNGGDELTLKFAASELPAKPPGTARDFFLFTSGWDKDADYHVVAGDTVEPIPWHRMNDQSYGKEQWPVFDGDAWIKKYNTRWVGPLTLERSVNNR